MLAVMVAPTVGINPLIRCDCHPRGHRHRQLGASPGGRRRDLRRADRPAGDGLPVTLVALLISVEPLIDMGAYRAER